MIKFFTFIICLLVSDLYAGYYYDSVVLNRSITNSNGMMTFICTPPYSGPFTYIAQQNGTLTIDGWNTSVGGSKESITNLVIPSSIVGLTVTSIGNYALSGFVNVKSLIIPNSIKSIDLNSFDSCTAVTNLVIGNSVTTLGPYSFKYCSELRSLVIPNSVTYIGNYAFEGCINLLSVTFGNSITGINNLAFLDNKLETLNFPESLKQLGYGAFFSNTPLLKYATFNGNAPTIGIVPFNTSSPGFYIRYYNGKTGWTNPWNGYDTECIDCSYTGPLLWSNNGNGTATITGWNEAIGGPRGAISKIRIPTYINGLEVSDIEDLSYCYSLTSLVVHSSTKNIGYAAFEGCTSLVSVVFHGPITNIGSYAFFDCKSLKSLIIPNSAKSIGPSAFRNCSSLTNVVIGNSINTIGNYAFRGCTTLTTATFLGNAPTTFGSLVFEGAYNVRLKYYYGMTGWSYPWNGYDTDCIDCP